MRQRSTLPGRHQPSTIDVLGLNFCVRDGNRWNPQAIATAMGELTSSGFPRNLTTAYEPFKINSSFLLVSSNQLNQAIDRLVSSSCMHYCTSTDDLSPGSLPGVSRIAAWSLILKVGFTLRCLQRLSHPHFASLLCRWHDNSCTSGASIPVLSYQEQLLS